MHIFLTSNGGCGKSFLTKVIYWAGKNIISQKTATLHKPQLLILAPTGVDAINVAGITMHTALQTPMETFGKTLPELNDKMKSSLINKLCEIKMIIIDQISMLSNVLI